MDALSESYRYCCDVSRRASSSFYIAFLLLPKPKRLAMCALYAFARSVDDVADGDAPVEAKIAALDRWRAGLQQHASNRSVIQDTSNDLAAAILPALLDAAHRYQIPHRYLHEIIDGVAMDLAPRRFETFADLDHYCYHVASAVGLCCIHIWGFHDRAALEPARACGIAFQLTNILRDLAEDATRGRVYLPQEDLVRFSYTEDQLARGVADERFLALVDFEIARAKQLYAQAKPLGKFLAKDGRRVWTALVATYYALLMKIERERTTLLQRRIRLSKGRRIWIAAKSAFGGSRLASDTATESIRTTPTP